jgi:quercetin dioxygenase-like cupin family protein
MKKNLLASLAFVLLLCLGPVFAFSQGLDQKTFDHILPEKVAFGPYAAFPPGALISFLVGTPTEPKPFVIRVKLTNGTKLMPHVHQEDRVYTVISGIFYIGIGKVFDPSKLKAYPPGSVIVLPANTPHFHWAMSGDYIAQIYAVGPLKMTYLNPTDDPRNKK